MSKTLDYIEEGDEIISEEALLELEGVMPHAQIEYSKRVSSVYDDSKSFEQNLHDLFSRYRKSKLKYIPKIVREFKGREQEAFDYLYYKYVLQVDALMNRSDISDSKLFISSKHDSLPKTSQVQIKRKKNNQSSIIWILVSVAAILLVSGILWYFLSRQEDHSSTPSNTPSASTAGMGIIESSQEKLKTALSKEDSIRIIEQALDEGMPSSDKLNK